MKAKQLRSLERAHRLFAWRRGQSTAEFALVVAPMLLLFFAIINFAFALYAYEFVSDGAQQAVRYAVVHGTTATQTASTADIQNYVKGLVAGILDKNALTVTTTWLPDKKPGSLVTVVVTYNYKPLTKMFPAADLSLTRTAAMVISQ